MVGYDITGGGLIKTEKTHLPTPPRMGYKYWLVDGSAIQKDETILFTFDNITGM